MAIRAYSTFNAPKAIGFLSCIEGLNQSIKVAYTLYIRGFDKCLTTLGFLLQYLSATWITFDLQLLPFSQLPRRLVVNLK